MSKTYLNNRESKDAQEFITMIRKLPKEKQFEVYSMIKEVELISEKEEKTMITVSELIEKQVKDKEMTYEDEVIITSDCGRLLYKGNAWEIESTLRDEPILRFSVSSNVTRIVTENTLMVKDIVRYADLAHRKIFIPHGIGWKPEYAEEEKLIDEEMAELRPLIDKEKEKQRRKELKNNGCCI